MRIKTNDEVVVLSGKDRGKKGKVTAVDLEASKVTVEGVNEVKRHVRRSQRNMQGGRLSKMMPVPVAKVMLVQLARSPRALVTSLMKKVKRIASARSVAPFFLKRRIARNVTKGILNDAKTTRKI